jgi:PH (Pleckstrin Homology) domain-containing protein/zinc ribbon protein
MAIVSALKSLINNLVTNNYTEIPEKIQTGLVKYLNDNEEVLFTLLDYRAIYKAPKWVDSNTFFNSWFVLTNHRIIIARNTSSFKRFRDIPLNDITQIFYELEGLEGKISITCPGKEDIIEFSKATNPYYGSLEKELKNAFENAKGHKRVVLDTESILCAKCGSKIGSDSKYCPECGARVSSF